MEDYLMRKEKREKRKNKNKNKKEIKDNLEVV